MDIVLHIHYDKPVKVPLMLLLVWKNIALGFGLNANIALGFTLWLASQLHLCATLPIVHSLL